MSKKSDRFHTLKIGEFVRFDGKKNSGSPVIGEVTKITGEIVVIFGEWTGTMQPKYAFFEFYGAECIRTERPDWWQK
jgi:hypothetical protein